MADLSVPTSQPVALSRVRLETGLLLMALALAAVSMLVVYPIVLLLLNSLNEAGIGQPPQYGLGQWQQAFASPSLMISLWNTVLVFLTRQVIAFPVAILVAWLLARTNLPMGRGLELMFGVSFFLPALSIAMGWVLLLDPNIGMLNQLPRQLGWTAESTFNIYSFWGIIWTHLMAHAISIKVMLLTPAFRLMDSALDEASHASGANNLQTILRVSAPILLPELVVVGLLSALRMFESFEIEQLVGVPFGFFVYSTKLVALTRETPPLYGQATALGSLTLGLVLILLVIQRRMLGRRSFTTVSGRTRASKVDLGVWKWPIFGALVLTLTLLVIVPVTANIAASLMTRFGYFTLTQVWTLEHWQRALRDPAFLLSLRNTVFVGLVTAIIAPLIFSMVAYLIARTRLKGRGTLDTMVWLPQAIPGVLTSLALLWLVLSTPPIRPIYGTMWMLVLAFLISHMPISVQLTRASLTHFSQELEEASLASGAGWWQTYRQIVLPLLAPTMVTVGLLQFIFASQNVASVALLASGDHRTLAVLALDFVREGLRESAAVYTTLVVAMTAVLAMLLGWVSRKFDVSRSS
jgi:iron(III) transport system permease protein